VTYFFPDVTKVEYDAELEEKLLEETAKLENLLEKSEGENREKNSNIRERAGTATTTWS
jgi:hypothetical protein